MANNIIKRVWNQGSMTPIEDLQGSAFTNENGGHTFQISGVDSNGEALALSGTVAASFLRPDQTTVGISGSVSGGVASVTLSEECYGIPGRFGLVVFLTSDGKKTAIYSCVGNVARSSTDAVAPGVVADVVDLINEIQAAVDTIPASYSALMADIAPTYSSSALYAVGDYAWYEGDLKRCIVPITVGETYTPAHWTSAVVGDDVCALKSAINYNVSYQSDRMTVIDGKIVPFMERGYINSDGTISNYGNYIHGAVNLAVGDTVAANYANVRFVIGMMVSGTWDSKAMNSAADNFTVETAGTYLLHARKPDNTSITVSDAVNIINALRINRPSVETFAESVARIDESIEEINSEIDVIEEKLPMFDNFPVAVDAKYNKEMWNDLKLHDNAKRVCTDVFPVMAGMTLCIYKGSGQYSIRYWKDELKADNEVLHTDWRSENWYYYTFQYDGFAYVLFRKNASNPNYPVSDFDGNITLVYNNAKQIQATTEQYILDKSVAISDSFKYTVGDCTGLVYDESRGIAYMIYNTSEDDYGESHDIIALAYFPVEQPWRCKYVEVCREGGTIGEETISSAREENILFISSTQIRIFLYIATNALSLAYRYIDFDPSTETFGELHTCYIDINGTSTTVNAYDIKQYVTGQGGTFNSVDVIIPTKLNVYNDTLYATICPGSKGSLTGDLGGNTIVVTSDDYGATFEIKSIIPVIGLYETALAKDSDGLLYALCRPAPITANTANAKKIWISDDDGETFTSYDFYLTSTTRPQLLTYKGKILSLSSVYDNVTQIPKRAGTNVDVTDRNRNNLQIRLGSGTDMNNFVTKFSIFSQHELTYYSAIIVDDVLYIGYLTNDLYGKTRGSKNVIKFVRIGEFYTDSRPTDWYQI